MQHTRISYRAVEDALFYIRQNIVEWKDARYPYYLRIDCPYTHSNDATASSFVAHVTLDPADPNSRYPLSFRKPSRLRANIKDSTISLIEASEILQFVVKNVKGITYSESEKEDVYFCGILGMYNHDMIEIEKMLDSTVSRDFYRPKDIKTIAILAQTLCFVYGYNDNMLEALMENRH